ncbi:transferase [Alishewanella longhuensis]|uniref:Transferase n=1 Tax=Alishewanella longhuensis TaxID=1091037 RepID=A0ABQ3KY44_9ALTE|nr:phosphocholine cytidylyltransferase family protein [Alishewanella longhuensis]GHG69345.1 transferase [Alishewanella longhuensis]
MKVIILAAGMGTRLRPYTEHCPKALVPLNGKPLLEYQLDTLARNGITDITLLTGYLAQCFDKYQLPGIINPDYLHTNMLWSLLCARSLFDSKQDVLVCYGDIIYTDAVLQAVLQQPGEVVVAADKDWQALWQLRMEDPLADAESFQMAPDNRRVLQLGQKLNSLLEAQAQYIGLIKFSATAHSKILSLYDALPAAQQQKMYMTDFIQYLIDNDMEVNAALHHGGWLEVDTTADLKLYQQHMARLLQQ